MAIFATWQSEDFNGCRPTKIILRFFDVTRLDYLGACGRHPAHGIALDPVFTSDPPPNTIAIDMCDGFYIACHRMVVETCTYEPVDADDT